MITLPTNMQEEINKLKIRPDLVKYRRFDFYLSLWEGFFEKIWMGEVDDRILDFGCGCGYLNYVSDVMCTGVVTGLDVKRNPEIVFNDVREILGVDDYTVLYNGRGRLPFELNEFQAIVSRSSFWGKMHCGKENKVKDEEYDDLQVERVEEFLRISSEDAKWYISPWKQGDIVNNILTKVGNKKHVEVIAWCGDHQYRIKGK